MAKIDKKNKAGLIPWIFVAFFATFISADIVFFNLARNSSPGVATKDSYHKGKNYNEVLQKVKDQKKLGWGFQSKLTQIGKKIARLDLCLLNKNGKKIKNAKVLVKLKRPVKSGEDFQQNLIEQNGCYMAKIFFPQKGQWDFEFVAFKSDDQGDKVFQDVKRYIIR